jgi:hypothetical protein
MTNLKREFLIVGMETIAAENKALKKQYQGIFHPPVHRLDVEKIVENMESNFSESVSIAMASGNEDYDDDRKDLLGVLIIFAEVISNY